MSTGDVPAPPPDVRSDGTGPVTTVDAAILLAGLGGRKNILEMTAVAGSRLRVVLANADVVDEKVLSAAGAHGLMRLGGGIVHVLVGPGAASVADEINEP